VRAASDETEARARVTPDEEILIPKDPRKLMDRAHEIVEACRVSVSRRAAEAQNADTFVETGRPDGIKSLMNLMYYQEDRLAAHLYSPTALNFALEADHEYPEDVLIKLSTAAKLLTRNWEANNTDMLFGQGVQSALRFGCTLMKQWAERTETDGCPSLHRSLIMPWQFGVWNESLEELDRQPAFCDTSMLTLPEVWKRIYHFEDAHKLLNRIRTHAQKDNVGLHGYGFLQQVFSTSILQTSTSTPYLPKPGGIINLNPSPNYAFSGPEIGVETVPFHELWVWNGDDYCTIQFIEPDILIAPRLKPCNLLIGGSKLHPYTTIRPSPKTNNFWGRSFAADLIELQNWLSESSMDLKRLLGLQVDRILGFQGDDGITDEQFGQMKDSGYFKTSPGATITDLTPPIPAQMLEIMNFVVQTFDKIGGFGNILDGSGEPGVRSGTQTHALIKTASPTLRDRSLLVERQCAQAADLTFKLMRAKDATTYWTDADKSEETSFLLDALPDDCMAVVDSHSSSPIFADDHVQLVFACVKAGIIDNHTAIELLPLPKKDLLQRRLKSKEAATQQMLARLEKEDPEAFQKIIAKGGHK
jgi:hypothetical protein